MKKSINKRIRILSVEINYDSIDGLRNDLDDLFRSVKKGVEMDDTKSYKFNHVPIVSDENFRIEEINGQNCIIFSSAINQQNQEP